MTTTSFGVGTKLMLWTVLVLAGGLVLLFASVRRSAQDVSSEQTVFTASKILGQFKTLRSYYTANVVAKVAKETDLDVSFDHAERADAIPLPATMIHDLSALFGKEDQNIRLRLYSDHPFPNRANRVLDGFARQALDSVASNPDEPFVSTEVLNGHDVVRVAIADRLTAQACVDCHNTRPDTPKSNWRLGDVRGVLEVICPLYTRAEAGFGVLDGTSGIVAAVIAGIIAVIYLVTRRCVSEPLARTMEVLDRLADGDLTQRMVVRGNDEIGRMGTALNRSVAEFEESLVRIGGAAHSLTYTSERIAARGTQLSERAEETSTRLDVVSSSIAQITDGASNVATSTEELLASIREIAENSAGAARVAEEAVQVARGTNTVITKLTGSSSEIGEVVRVITSIAEQTNLLALNATIEAARAGDAGKGFAVVANEVKELAQQTRQATEDIGRKIETIQGDTADAVEAIDRVSAVIEKISQMQISIASAVEEQSAVSDEISRNVSGVSQRTSMISKNVADVTAVAKGTRDDAAEIRSAAASLDQLASQLSQLVAAFKCERRDADPSGSTGAGGRPLSRGDAANVRAALAAAPTRSAEPAVRP